MSLEKAPITPYGEEETYSSNPFAFCKNFLNFFNSTDFRTANSKYFTFHPKLKDLFLLRGNFAKLKFSSGEEPAQYVGFELFYFFFYFVTIFTLAAFNLVYYSRVTRLFFVKKNKQNVNENTSVFVNLNFDSGGTNSLKVFHKSEKVKQVLVN